MKTAIFCFLCFFFVSCTCQPSSKNNEEENFTNCADGVKDSLKAIVVNTTFILYPNLLTEKGSNDEVYMQITEKPQFPGGMRELISFIQKNIQYPSTAFQSKKQGRVIVQAIIDTDGSVVQPSVVHSIDSLLDREALRIVQIMPRWKPGTHHGTPVKVKYHFPVTFKIDDTPVLYPAFRDIPTGEAINPDSLSIKTEYDYYPLSTTEVEIVITNHSHYEYDCGEEYSLAYYNPAKQQWETLPTNPIVNSILWIFPSQHSTHEQTIRLYTSEVSNRPGKYRIYKAFNRKTKVAYAEFEMIDKKGVEQLRNRIHDYMSNCMNSITAKNICMTYTKNTDTIFVVLINNAPRFQEMFKREVISYSAVNHGKIQKPTHFIPAASLDTLQITMKTEKPAYPAGTENIKVILTNNSPQRLFFGTAYTVARKVGKQWILLNAFNCWDSLGILLDSEGTYRFVANLYPLFNDNPPGIYRVYKEVGFDGSSEKWFMAAEFSIE